MLLVLLLTAALTQSEETSALAPAPEGPPVAAPSQVLIPGCLKAGTPVFVETTQMISSTTSRIGDRFPIRLAEPVMVNGAPCVSPGATGQGEIIDVAPAGMGGRQAKLVVAARYLELDGRQVRIRGMSLMSAGESQVDLATGLLLVPYAGLAVVFLKGGEIAMPSGTRATAKLAEDFTPPIQATSNPEGLPK
jgi:hypothetical protein